jgi:hypothetical protein
MAIPTVQITGPVNLPGGGLARGARVLARLSQPGTVMDGGAAETIAESVGVTLGSDGGFRANPLDPNALNLTPNDAIVPSGTHWEVTFSVQTTLGRKVWTEKWQLASAPSPIDVGSVPRLGVVDGQSASLSFRGLLATAPGRADAWAALGVSVGPTPPSAAKTLAQWIADGTGYHGWLDTSAPSVSATAPSADLSLTAAPPTALLLGSLIPANGNFVDDVTATSETVGEWWKTVVGTGESGRHASVEMTGAYVGRVFSPSAGNEGYLAYRFTRAEIDATRGILTFDLRMKTAGGRLSIVVDVTDAGGSRIVTVVNSKHQINVYGVAGPDADNTTVIPVTADVTKTISYNLKEWITARLDPGKTWADVSKVVWYLSAVNGGNGEFWVDNFR